MYADNISLYLCFLSVPFQNPLINRSLIIILLHQWLSIRFWNLVVRSELQINHVDHKSKRTMYRSSLFFYKLEWINLSQLPNEDSPSSGVQILAHFTCKKYIICTTCSFQPSARCTSFCSPGCLLYWSELWLCLTVVFCFFYCCCSMLSSM